MSWNQMSWNQMSLEPEGVSGTIGPTYMDCIRNQQDCRSGQAVASATMQAIEPWRPILVVPQVRLLRS